MASPKLSEKLFSRQEFYDFIRAHAYDNKAPVRSAKFEFSIPQSGGLRIVHNTLQSIEWANYLVTPISGAEITLEQALMLYQTCRIMAQKAIRSNTTGVDGLSQRHAEVVKDFCIRNKAFGDDKDRAEQEREFDKAIRRMGGPFRDRTSRNVKARGQRSSEEGDDISEHLMFGITSGVPDRGLNPAQRFRKAWEELIELTTDDESPPDRENLSMMIFGIRTDSYLPLLESEPTDFDRMMERAARTTMEMSARKKIAVLLNYMRASYREYNTQDRGDTISPL